MTSAMWLIFSSCLCRGNSSSCFRVSGRFRGAFRGANSAARSTASNPTTKNCSQRICASTGPNGLIQTPPAQVAINTNRKGHTNPVRRILLRVTSAKMTNKTRATAKDVRNSLSIIAPILDKRFPCHLQSQAIYKNDDLFKMSFHFCRGIGIEPVDLIRQDGFQSFDDEVSVRGILFLFYIDISDGDFRPGCTAVTASRPDITDHIFC